MASLLVSFWNKGLGHPGNSLLVNGLKKTACLTPTDSQIICNWLTAQVFSIFLMLVVKSIMDILFVVYYLGGGGGGGAYQF